MKSFDRIESERSSESERQSGRIEVKRRCEERNREVKGERSREEPRERNQEVGDRDRRGNTLHRSAAGKERPLGGKKMEETITHSKL
jgi:hypothetical protein